MGLGRSIVIVGTSQGEHTSTPGAAYLFAPRGNSVVNPGETCDDGNTTDGDGCSSTCQTE